MTEVSPKAAEAVSNEDDAAASRAKRIKDKIAASTARSSGKAPSRSGPKPPDAAPSGPDERNLFTRALDDHPLALVAGGMVLGAVAASLVPASVMRKISSRAFGIVALAGEMGALYGSKALEKGSQAARAGQERLEDLGESAADHASDARARAIDLGLLAARRAIDLATEARSTARDTGDGLAKRISAFADRARP